MRRGNKIIFVLMIILIIFLSQANSTATVPQSKKHDANTLTDIIKHIKGMKSGDLPDIAITRLNAWYVIEPLNENDNIITQNVLICVMNIGNLKTGPYSVTLNLYAMWEDHEEIIQTIGLWMGVFGTAYNWHTSKLNWPSLQKPLQYRAEISTDLQEEESYGNNIITVPCKDGFRISGNVTLSLIKKLIARGVPPIIIIEDVNPRYSINLTAFDIAERNGSTYQYSFTVPIRDTPYQVRAFLSPYPLAGFFFPKLKFPLLCILTSKVKVIDLPNPNEHIWVDFQF